MPEKIAVLGAGTMGAGIAQLAAQSGYDVLLYDIKEEYIQRGIENIRKPLQSRVDRGKMDAAALDTILGRIKTTTQRDDAAVSDFIVEAAPEDLALKQEIFSSLGGMAPANAILATNTSSLSITSIGAASQRPERVVGMHFFNPAPVMPLVEIIAGSRTSPDVVQAVSRLAASWGKSVVNSADTPGFIVNRVARPFYGEALKVLGEGSATVPQIDAAMRAAGFKMGPFELMDLIGIDINFAVTCSVYNAFFGEPRFRPHPAQQRMVEAGTIGRKSGQGFYKYINGEKGDTTLTELTSWPHKRGGTFVPYEVAQEFSRKAEISLTEEGKAQAAIIARILAMIMNEAAFAVGEGVASVRDIDTAMRLGTSYPKGPLKWADQIGLELVFSVLKSLQANLGEERYRPAPLLWHMVTSGMTGDAMGEGFHTPGEKGMV
ncbi:MAG: 3-hydroxybutyryl-CoA dehydrogenase [Chloroflexi bacterium]|nr:3-hydroxybutyryl-CoA dehydrogenase [Chloroflexota bacterium]